MDEQRKHTILFAATLHLAWKLVDSFECSILSRKAGPGSLSAMPIPAREPVPFPLAKVLVNKATDSFSLRFLRRLPWVVPKFLVQ